MPLGAVQPGSWWYALARMGVSTMGIHVWGMTRAGAPVHKKVVILSRVIERTAVMATTMMEEVLRRLDEEWHLKDAFDAIDFWSDGAKQFKCRRVLAAVGWKVLEKYGMRRTSYHYGCEEHFKSLIDGMFGVLSNVRATISKTTCEVEEAGRP